MEGKDWVALALLALGLIAIDHDANQSRSSASVGSVSDVSGRVTIAGTYYAPGQGIATLPPGYPVASSSASCGCGR